MNGERKNNMFEELRDLICKQIGIEKEKITLDTNIRKDIKADSAELLEMILDIEEKYDLEMPEDLDKIQTVGDIVKYIEENK